MNPFMRVDWRVWERSDKASLHENNDGGLSVDPAFMAPWYALEKFRPLLQPFHGLLHGGAYFRLGILAHLTELEGTISRYLVVGLFEMIRSSSHDICSIQKFSSAIRRTEKEEKDYTQPESDHPHLPSRLDSPLVSSLFYPWRRRT